MLDYIILISAVFLISFITFLFMVQKDNEDREEDLDVYICDVCNSEECVCKKESGKTAPGNG